MASCRWKMSAPLRTFTVGDAMSNLPEIRNGNKREEMANGREPILCFQWLVSRQFGYWLCEISSSSVHKYKCVFLYDPYKDSLEPVSANTLRSRLQDTVPLIEARITHIPTAVGCDWCDLPNIVVRLSDRHSQTNCPTVAVSTVSAPIHYFVIMQCSKLFKPQSLSLPAVNILLCIPFSVDNSVNI